MNPTKKDERTDSIYRPCSPSRRKPLNRMNNTTPKSSKTKQLNSPVLRRHADPVNDPEISEDDVDNSEDDVDNSEDDENNSCQSVENSPIGPSSNSPSSLPKEVVYEPESAAKPNNGFNVTLLFVIAMCVCLSAIQFYPYLSKISLSTPISASKLSKEVRMNNLKADINRMKKKFQIQTPNSWYDILSGVEDVLDLSLKPWMIVLVSDDAPQISCFAELLGNISSRVLLTNDQLILHPADFGNDYGDAIDHFKPQIEEKKVVVVHDLLNIHGNAIQAFHTMCDRENPLVKEAVYIITIITPTIIGSQSIEAFTEKILTKTFVNKIPDDKLQPLVTRLTDGPIIRHVPAKNPTAGCSL